MSARSRKGLVKPRLFASGKRRVSTAEMAALEELPSGDLISSRFDGWKVRHYDLRNPAANARGIKSDKVAFQRQIGKVSQTFSVSVIRLYLAGNCSDDFRSPAMLFSAFGGAVFLAHF